MDEVKSKRKRGALPKNEYSCCEGNCDACARMRRKERNRKSFQFVRQARRYQMQSRRTVLALPSVVSRRQVGRRKKKKQRALKRERRVTDSGYDDKQTALGSQREVKRSSLPVVKSAASCFRLLGKAIVVAYRLPTAASPPLTVVLTKTHRLCQSSEEGPASRPFLLIEGMNPRTIASNLFFR